MASNEQLHDVSIACYYVIFLILLPLCNGCDGLKSFLLTVHDTVYDVGDAALTGHQRLKGIVFI
jgi:hypothetical protein